MEQILTMSAKIVGGIGVILLGMVLMTDSLKSLGGDTMKRVLYRLTKNSFVSVLSGAGFTALIHNSSAVILATVGFVGAGLLGFSNAIGVIFGANLGTTSTAWVVALVGFKLNIGIIILPMVAIGAFMKLFMKGSRASAGLAIAGFALLFVGIDVLNEGMRHLPHHITLSNFTLNNVFDEALLVGVGIVMTIALQSSTVAIVTTITAVNAGAITLEQATLLIIGQNIGKLYYGVIASIGVSVSAKRLAVVHIMFNVLTGLVIFALHSHFTRTVVAMCDIAGVTNPAIILSAFHTSFNFFGIVLFLPLIGQVRKVAESLVPEKVSPLIRRLDFSTTKIPSVAIETVRITLEEIAALILSAMKDLILADRPFSEIVEKIDEADDALVHTGAFLSHIRSEPESALVRNQHLDVLHAAEHLTRLAEACREIDVVRTTAKTSYLRQLALDHIQEIDDTILWMQGKRKEAPTESIEQISMQFAEIRKKMRTEILDQTAQCEVQADEAFRLLEAMRWIDRLAYHVWRATFHLSGHRRRLPVA